ncbi:MAG: hypothetical protein ABIP96_02120 [Patescibacteria group bacterium]
MQAFTQRPQWVERGHSLCQCDPVTDSRFPELKDYSDGEFSRFGYSPKWVSYFDHWLSEDEAASSNVMSHDLASSAGASDEYRMGEEKLEAFYGALFEAGAIRLVEGEPVVHTAFDEALAQVVTSSLREKKLMDCYVSHLSMRVVGGYDRTDLLLFETAISIPLVEQLASNSGLFLLT